MKRSIMLGLMLTVVSMGALAAAPAEARHCNDNWQGDRHCRYDRYEGMRNYERAIERQQYAAGRWGGYPGNGYNRGFLGRIF
jgi:hypothetical protein